MDRPGKATDLNKAEKLDGIYTKFPRSPCVETEKQLLYTCTLMAS